MPKTVVSFDESNLGNVEELPEIEFGDIEPSRRRRQAETMSELAPDPNLDFAQPRNASATYFFPPDYFLASQAFIPRWPTASGLTESEATDVCAERLFDSDIALNCSNYLGSYLGTAFEFCKADLQVSIRISAPCQFFTLSTCSILRLVILPLLTLVIMLWCMHKGRGARRPGCAGILAQCTSSWEVCGMETFCLGILRHALTCRVFTHFGFSVAV